MTERRDHDAQTLGRGQPGGSGTGSGELHVDVDDALDAIDAGRPVALAVATTGPGHVPALTRAAAVITARGDLASHAAVVTRSAHVPCVLSVEALTIDGGGIHIGDLAIPVGATLTVDGDRGELRRPLVTVAGLQLGKATRLPMEALAEAEIEKGAGMIGDRYHGSRHRHLSVQSLDELREAAADHGGPIDPLLTRRNVTISSGRVPRTPGHRWRLGPVTLEVVRDAAPCRMLDMEIGNGARTALRRRAGVICRVIDGGLLRVGDAVDLGGEGYDDT